MSAEDSSRQAVHDAISQLAAIRLRCELLLRAAHDGDHAPAPDTELRAGLEQIHELADGAQALLSPLLIRRQ